MFEQRFLSRLDVVAKRANVFIRFTFWICDCRSTFENSCISVGSVQLTVVRKESLFRHEDLIREDRGLMDIQGKQVWDDHNRTKI